MHKLVREDVPRPALFALARLYPLIDGVSVAPDRCQQQENDKYQILEEVARSTGATPRQVALKFLISRKSVFTIPKASRVSHVEENAAAAEIELSTDDLKKLDAGFPAGEARSLPMI